MNIIEELEWRGLIKQISNIKKIIKSQNLSKSVYCGFDPTNDSLHIGHLILIILLERFSLYHFKPIIVLGYGTGQIGDPSGKKLERPILHKKILLNNYNKIKKQILKLTNNIKIINNKKWLKKIKLIDFLRLIGKDFNISYLLHKNNIISRINTGLSYTEFSYILLQVYDFYQLYQNYNCTVQVGGSDQWGNIIAGIWYINKKNNFNNLSCGLTINLLTNNYGNKLGKSDKEVIWLDAKKTTPYEFYQFFLNQTDEETFKLLKFFTFLTKSEISNLENKHKQFPCERIGQFILAEKITIFVHGNKHFKQVKMMSTILFQNKFSDLTKNNLQIINNNLPKYKLKGDENILINLLIQSNIAISKKEANNFLLKNAIYINGQIFNNGKINIKNIPFLYKKYLIIKKGKKKFFLIKK